MTNPNLRYEGNVSVFENGKISGLRELSDLIEDVEKRGAGVVLDVSELSFSGVLIKINLFSLDLFWKNQRYIMHVLSWINQEWLIFKQT